MRILNVLIPLQPTHQRPPFVNYSATLWTIFELPITCGTPACTYPPLSFGTNLQQPLTSLLHLLVHLLPFASLLPPFYLPSTSLVPPPYIPLYLPTPKKSPKSHLKNHWITFPLLYLSPQNILRKIKCVQKIIFNFQK